MKIKDKVLKAFVRRDKLLNRKFNARRDRRWNRHNKQLGLYLKRLQGSMYIISYKV